MSVQDPRPDVAPEEQSAPEGDTLVSQPVSPSATTYEAATVSPGEPETVPDLAAPASFTVPHDEPAAAPSDKLWVHFVWEGLLLVLIALGVAAFFLFGPNTGLGSPDRVMELLVGSTPFLLFAMALGLSMRVGSINLAVVHLGLLSTVLFSSLGNQPLLTAIGIVAGAMVAAGVLLSLLVTVFKAPGWAASLLVAMAAWFLVSERELGLLGPMTPDSGLSAQLELTGLTGWIIIGVVVGLSIAGGILGIVRPVRETFGVCVDAVEQRGRRTAGAFLTTWVALIGSCLLAGAAGYLVLVPTGANLNINVVEANGLAPLLTGLGIVLIGGTSARGRRGGVFGTLLAAVVVFMVALLVQNLNGSWIVNNAIPFGALLLGLLVNWLMDLMNRPKKTYGAHYTAMASDASLSAPIYTPVNAPASPAADFGAAQSVPVSPAPDTVAPVAEPVSPMAASPGETLTLPADPPASGDSTQEIPADANPYLYRPPAG